MRLMDRIASHICRMSYRLTGLPGLSSIFFIVSIVGISRLHHASFFSAQLLAEGRLVADALMMMGYFVGARFPVMVFAAGYPLAGIITNGFIRRHGDPSPTHHIPGGRGLRGLFIKQISDPPDSTARSFFIKRFKPPGALFLQTLAFLPSHHPQ